MFSSGGRLLELRRGNNEGADIMGEIEFGFLREPGEDRVGESRASKYGEDDDDEENNLEDLSEDIDLFENNAVSDGRFTLVILKFCELDSDRNRGTDGRSVENCEEEGVPGAVRLAGNATGGWEAVESEGEVRTKSGMLEGTSFSLVR